MKRRRETENKRSKKGPGNRSQAGGRTLTSYSVGALPILDRIIKRARLPEFLQQFMVEDKRCVISPVTGTLVLLKNYLVSREPIYGISEWARQYAPDLLGLSARQVSSLNDDRVGRCLDGVFQADCPKLVLAVTRHVVEEFNIDLSEIHDDSTTVTFFGDYDGASRESTVNGKRTPAITWGHNKDHRPDLKQLLFNLTVTWDGAVPIVFGVENGNVTDDQTHRATWDLLCQVVGSPDFLYVADSKLATHPNMIYIANRGGRFLSVLPRSRGEDKEFRKKLVAGSVQWEEIRRKYDDEGLLVDIVSTAKEPAMTSEGFRLVWYHSTRKVQLDRKARAKRIDRAFGDLSSLRLKLRSPRTRYREYDQVAKAVRKRLVERKATEWVTVDIVPEDREVFRQVGPGRPGARTAYRKQVKRRFDIMFRENKENIQEAEKQDGVFPLVTNERDLSVADLLSTYKRQAQIEKRFAQFKTQFEVAPVFLKNVHRVVALLTIYYFALLVQALLERELRLRMAEEGMTSLPLYPEERKCKAPTTRRIIDVFENIQMHVLQSPGSGSSVRFATGLSDLQREILRLLEVAESDYEA
ncbi:MAG: IS1634 family transposase [Candidatus Thermoplasmatota archaeon]|nr:IS1634 family transposase [Candidatus Thermoplasmatota archaeon]